MVAWGSKGLAALDASRYLTRATAQGDSMVPTYGCPAAVPRIQPGRVYATCGSSPKQGDQLCAWACLNFQSCSKPLIILLHTPWPACLQESAPFMRVLGSYPMELQLGGLDSNTPFDSINEG
eukprot:GHRQ01018371.1.p2 GENE.GHRQ01018371.1~~GHRQ01018371.1.p2  ORF type:complete len:122 (-),score=11.40 GHRQ01018371.1:695-1060(-)